MPILTIAIVGNSTLQLWGVLLCNKQAERNILNFLMKQKQTMISNYV